ncbi:MAG: hypothetical protein KF791_20815 [Verrucomicrobiae bacterium]|nr:hypothetical protein [Verrucomicrobiae bacterium]
MCRHLLTIYISAQVLILVARAAEDTPTTFHVAGRVITQQLFANKNAEFFYRTNTSEFTVDVEGCQWLIEIFPEDKQLFDSAIISCDGNATYRLLNYTTRLTDRFAGHIPSYNNIGDAFVSEGVLARDPFVPAASIVWLAYCSSCQFEAARAGSQTNLNVPFANYVAAMPVSLLDPPLANRASFDLSLAPPHLPTKVTYYRNESDIPQQVATYFLDTAFTNISFSASAFTNAGPWSVPTRASWLGFRPDRDLGSGGPIRLAVRMTLEADEILPASTIRQFRPGLGFKTAITDGRFFASSGFAFTYYITNKWLSKDEAKGLRQYREAEAAYVQGEGLAKEQLEQSD